MEDSRADFTSPGVLEALLRARAIRISKTPITITITLAPLLRMISAQHHHHFSVYGRCREHSRADFTSPGVLEALLRARAIRVSRLHHKTIRSLNVHLVVEATFHEVKEGTGGHRCVVAIKHNGHDLRVCVCVHLVVEAMLHEVKEGSAL